MVEEDEAKANAAEILQPLSEMLEASQLESGPGHSGAGPEVGKRLEGSARQAREAQMDDLKHKTGDVLYPSAGEHSSISCFQCIGVQHQLLWSPTCTRCCTRCVSSELGHRPLCHDLCLWPCTRS